MENFINYQLPYLHSNYLFASMIILSLVLIFLLGLYVYTSFAYMYIGKKAKVSNPLLAWVPRFGPSIIAYKASKMHWWPWLLLIAYFIPYFLFFVAPIFLIIRIIWTWKMFEVIKKPGWWALLTLIPIVNLIIIGIAAWGD